jgi:hypothetical protein
MIAFDYESSVELDVHVHVDDQVVADVDEHGRPQFPSWAQKRPDGSRNSFFREDLDLWPRREFTPSDDVPDDATIVEHLDRFAWIVRLAAQLERDPNARYLDTAYVVSFLKARFPVLRSARAIDVECAVLQARGQYLSQAKTQRVRELYKALQEVRAKKNAAATG